ncbi:MAG: hypothetical protein R3360_00800 [Alphaproteobacteria bacterium]|nr:hypothetical protein [Alphaproteobacteria bacterium]
MRLFSVLVCVFLLSGCASSSVDRGNFSDLELTWYRGAVTLPPNLGESRVWEIGEPEFNEFVSRRVARPLPVAVYLHGCTGLTGNDRSFMKELATAGYAVVAPDSMARSWRPRQCNSRTKSGGRNLFVFDFRQAEINYAVQKLYDAPWADWDNMFLVGASEGGLAAAHYRGDYFSGRVITQWTCHGAPIVRGISAERDEPVLSIVRKDDPWYDSERGNQAGDCGRFFGERPNSRSLVLEKGSGHNVMGERQVIDAIIRFLKENTS